MSQLWLKDKEKPYIAYRFSMALPKPRFLCYSKQTLQYIILIRMSRLSEVCLIFFFWSDYSSKPLPNGNDGSFFPMKSAGIIWETLCSIIWRFDAKPNPQGPLTNIAKCYLLIFCQNLTPHMLSSSYSVLKSQKNCKKINI